MRRGQIWWAALGQPIGPAPGLRRPVVVVSSDTFNQSEIRTVAIVSITSNLRLASSPGNVLLTVDDSGVPKESVANVSQVSAIDKSRLEEHVGYLPVATMNAIDRGLRLVLAL